MPSTNRFPRPALVAAIALALAGCATRPPAPEPLSASSSALLAGNLDASAALTPQAATGEDRARIYRGNGVVVKGQQPGGKVPGGPPVQVTGGGVVLNFEGADLREVVRNVLGDILNESYTIDKDVGGQVTIRTTSGVPRDALHATLETLLRMNGATMVRESGVWKIVPAAAAVRGNVTPQLGSSQRPLPPGFSVQIVPLRYVGVREMAKILEPFARDPNSAIRVDDTRNLLILAGTEEELRHLMDTVDMFDIDWMAGMSVAIFTLKNADVKSVMSEFDKIIGDKAQSPLAGVLRVIPIERMNAILVISPNPQYLDEANKWIERLDAGGGEGPRLYVFNLRNERAEHIGPILQQAFTGRTSAPAGSSAPTVAPGTPSGQIVSPPAFSAQPAVPVANPSTAAAAGAVAGAAAARGITGGAGGGTGIASNVQVVADKDRNTILVVATPSEYAVIEQALRKLDVPARQVMMEVTIAEVQLSDGLQYGVEWLFKNAAPNGRGSGGFFSGSTPFNPSPITGTTTTTTTTTTAPALALSTGFNYILNSANVLGGVQAVLHLLDTYGTTRVVSNPHIAALDNQKATIKSGDRIPINQQTLVGGTTNAVTTTASYIDTGVLLQVTPHINAGGLITLDVDAEVSNPGTAANPGDAPPISTRSVQTMVSVPSGRTMVMGGLITEAKTNTTNGLPLVDRVPLLGALFGKTTLQNNRNELIVFITPRVIETELDSESIINDLRRRMESLDRVFPGTSTWPASPPSYLDRADKAMNPLLWELPRPVEPNAPSPPSGQPTQTPAPGQPAAAATPIPGVKNPVDIQPPAPRSSAAPAPAAAGSGGPAPGGPAAVAPAGAAPGPAPGTALRVPAAVAPAPRTPAGSSPVAPAPAAPAVPAPAPAGTP